MHLYNKLIYVFLVALLLFVSWRTQAQFPAPYCTAKFASGGVEPITRVSFSNINRTSSVSSTVGLEDYLTDTVVVTVGQPYTIAVEATTGGNYDVNVKVFIDWNQNNVFADTSGEMFDVGKITSSNGSDGKQATLSIPIPTYALLGNTRMRVIKKFGASNSNTTACSTGGYGQAEDYTIKIIQSSICLPPSGLAATVNTGTSVTFSWASVSGSAGYEYVVDQSSGNPTGPGTSVVATTATATITPAGTYYIHVRTDCGGGSFSSWATVPAAIPFPYPYCNITNLTGIPITSVQFAGINRTSSATIGGPSLENFLTDTGKVIPGLPYIITLKGNTNGGWSNHYRVFIDWDQDNVFTSSESYDAHTVTTSTGTDAEYTDDTIEAPLNAKLGYTRMRIVKKQGTALTNTNACPTTNADGQAEDYTILVMKSPVCLTPRGLKITSISGASVAFSWNPMHGVNGYEYIVNTMRTAPATAGTATTATSGSNIAPLVGNTMYYIHVRSDCGGGDFSAWALDSFVTCTPPSGLNATNLTHYSGEFSWNTISGIANYEYVIDQQATDPTGSGTVTTATTITDSSLTTNQTYYLHVRTNCGGGTYSIWTTYSFKSVREFCFIDVVRSKDIMPTTATLYWASLSSGRKGFEYIIDQNAAAPTTAGATLTDTFYNATSLQPNTKYYMHVRTDCYGGLYSFWRTEEFTTLPICYTLPSGLTANNITPSSATLLWNKINGVQGYQYVIDQVPTDPTTAGTLTTDTFVNKAGLTGGAVYYLHVRTDCGGGDYSYWATYKFAVCAEPLNLTATNITETTATVGWDAVSGAKEYEYLVDLSTTPPAGSTSASTITTGTSENVANLFGSTTYYLHVRTNCDKGNFSPWKTFGFTTQPPAGIQKITGSDLSFNVYPNPVKNIITYHVSDIKDAQIQVMDITGKVIYTVNPTANKGIIDVSCLTNGIYLAKYSNPTGNSVIKISKQ